jgi:hypothetical protein
VVAGCVALWAALALGAALTAAPPALALSDSAQECAACHNAENTGTVTVEGQPKPLAVDTARYEGSLHGQLDCSACHLGFEPGPHTPAQTGGWLKTARIDACGDCHADRFSMYEGSFPGTLALEEDSDEAPLCADCHTRHDNAAARDQKVCVKCHGGNSCIECHGLAMPHPAGFGQAHASTYYSSPGVCSTCHSSWYCSDCHGTSLPHSGSFRENHADAVSSNGTVCVKCHDNAGSGARGCYGGECHSGSIGE